MSDDPTPLSLPASLPYPITISRLHASPGQSILRGTSLLTYTFTSATATRELARIARGQPVSEGVRKEDVREWDMSATWESGIEGELVRWAEGLASGKVIERRHASRPVVWLQQACTHPVQLHGLCGICGADLTSDDYLSIPAGPQAGPSRHGGFEMSHDAMGVTVSSSEAMRLDSLTRDTLLRTRKLSLIVDLDQTIIHTTVDPTVGDWMAEIDEDERVQAQAQAQDASANQGATTTPPGSPTTKPRREPNPNADALRDVAKFELSDDPPPPGPGQRGKQPERWYYTKPRPGLPKFLDTMSEFYEMHVYTMGTRTYADAICRVIDPEGRIFGDRILSRDESGNFTSKNLKRLFPTDQSMVVVIDDRQDVWGDCPNLVKVVPYDFFVGIGDINSSFLPPSPQAPPTTPPSAAGASSDASTPPPVTPPTEEGTSEEDGLLLQQKLLDEVSEARPLAKLQEELEEQGGPAGPVTPEASDAAKQPDRDIETANGTPEAGTHATQDDSSHPVVKPRKPLLNDNDKELERLSRILKQIHTNFYDAFDHRGHSDLTPLPLGCDVELIVPEMKSQVLQGCALIFSGMIPRLQPPETTTVWQTAETFGAIPSMSLTPNITHCVAATLGTEKTYRASKLGVPVVWQGWFWESVNLWERQDESLWRAVEPVRDTAASNGNSANPTPGPSAPATPSIATNPLPQDSQDSPAGEDHSQEQEQGVGEDDFRDDEHFGEGWDDDAQAELDAFLEGSSDFGSDAGASVRSREGTPGTPSKKRVRYADEEHLPLESYKDPSPNDTRSPPAKKSKPLLLGPPDPDNQVPEANRFIYKDRGSSSWPPASTEAATEAAASSPLADEADAEEDDDFARMLQDELDEG